MNWYLLALPLIVVSVMAFHLSQKSIPLQADPFVVLAAAYLVVSYISIIRLSVTGDFRKEVELIRNQN